MPNLELKVPKNLFCQTPENAHEVLVTISKYQNHPSIKKNFQKCNFSFYLKTLSFNDVRKGVKSLD